MDGNGPNSSELGLKPKDVSFTSPKKTSEGLGQRIVNKIKQLRDPSPPDTLQTVGTIDPKVTSTMEVTMETSETPLENLEATNFLQETSPYLLTMMKVFPSTEFRFNLDPEGNIQIETKNANFSTQAKLRTATRSDLYGHIEDSYRHKPDDYFVVEDLIITGDNKEQINIGEVLKQRNILYFTWRLNQHSEGVINRLDEHPVDTDDEFISDARQFVYGVNSISYEGPIGGGIIAPLPIDIFPLFHFAHELGHREQDSITRNRKIKEVYKQTRHTQEEYDVEVNAITYVDERSASAFALNYIRNTCKKFNIPVSKFTSRLKDFYNSALYAYFANSHFLEEKNKPEANPDESSKYHRAHKLYESVIPLLMNEPEAA